jgi:hypothetical protein
MLKDRSRVENELAKALYKIPNCKQLFVLDASGRQIVDNITRNGPDASYFGRERSGRPYMQGLVGTTDFKLSQAYISRNRQRPMLTAVRVIRDENGERTGFLGADFDLRELPATQELYQQTTDWRQIKGDPAIRQGLFAQQRCHSIMDDRLDQILPVMNELMTERGIFHGKLHFSSSRATIWQSNDPFVYRLLDIEELLAPDICLAHPKHSYHTRAIVRAGDIMDIFQMFRQLRFADDNIYLRSGSLNLINGMVSLNFSCDGTHYLRHDDFLAKGMDFWFGHGG